MNTLDWAPERSLRICIATPDIVGPVRNGGIGTAYYWLSRALAAVGHEVTLLYTLGEYCEQDSIKAWQEHYRRQKLSFVPLPDDTTMPLNASQTVRCSYHTYQWLKQRTFDIIHFPEWNGHGFYSLLAKSQGLYFTNTVLCIGTHSPSRWHRMGQKRLTTSLDEIEVDFMERESIAMADAVISPSHYMLDWLRDQGWALPEAVWVRPNLISLEEYATVPNDSMPRAVNELVFFGRLEYRKGLELFCNALDRLNDSELCDFKVTFLGKADIINGQGSLKYLNSRSRNWSWPWKVISDLDHRGAIAYLSKAHRLAVMPSLVENSPYTVLECLCAHIPFVTSAIGGIPELIDRSRQTSILFDPEPVSLAGKLREALREGVLLASPAVSPTANLLDWMKWHDTIIATAPPQPSISALPIPKISICLSHFNRPGYLAQALDSLRAQDYLNFEVVLVDDGSTDPTAQEYLTSLEVEFAERGWQILRQENRYLGAARNHAARHARGDYLLFMDDDNIAKPHELSIYARAAQASGADILTCFADRFRGSGVPGPCQIPFIRYLPTGGSVVTGIFKNDFGDANALVRHEIFDAIGGFTEDYGVGHEDWEFFARTVLRGYRLQVVPEALFWYRMMDDSMVNITPKYENIMRPLRPYMEAMPIAIRDLIPFSHNLFHHTFTNHNQAIDQLAESHSSELEAWQNLIDEYWNSTSWKLLRPFRSAKLYFLGLPSESKPTVFSAQEAIQAINMIRNSTSWELMGPMRVISTALQGIIRRFKAKIKT